MTTKLPPLPERISVFAEGSDLDAVLDLQRATWNAAMEAAAKACADVPIDHVFTTTIAACASAIRSMKEPQ